MKRWDILSLGSSFSRARESATGKYVLFTDAQHEVNRLRDTLLQVARDCPSCGGNGMIAADACPDCTPLRKALAA